MPSGTDPVLVDVHVVEHTETLLTTVIRDVDGLDDEEIQRVPAALVDAYELALNTLHNVADAIVAYTEGRTEAFAGGAAPANAVRVPFGDPRYCWNPTRHQPHLFWYQVGDRTGRYDCDGAGRFAAQVLGLDQATQDGRP